MLYQTNQEFRVGVIKRYLAWVRGAHNLENQAVEIGLQTMGSPVRMILANVRYSIRRLYIQ